MENVPDPGEKKHNTVITSAVPANNENLFTTKKNFDPLRFSLIRYLLYYVFRKGSTNILFVRKCMVAYK